MKIYDHANNAIEVELPDKPIRAINVWVLSGDEVVTIVLEDGSIIEACIPDPHDGSKRFCEGVYVVAWDDIKRWLEFQPSTGSVSSIERMRTFGGREERFST